MAVRIKKKTVEDVLDELNDEADRQNLRGKYAIPFSDCKTVTNSKLEHTHHGVIVTHVTSSLNF